MKHSYTLEEFKSSVLNSNSIAQALTKLGLSPKGGNYRVFKKFQKLYNVDTSHFTGQGHLKGKTHNFNTIPLNQILVKDYDYSSNSLRKRLIVEGLKEHRCECCGLDEWLGELIPLELDHIDGDHSNNTIENLKILCPNCHAKTPTYRGKNKKKSFIEKQKILNDKPIYYCNSCNTKLKTNSKTGLCSACYSKSQRKVERPNKEQLLKEVSESSYVAVGKKYGVSDKSIRKWLHK
jgi:Zn finger protein HypA/HybF involved in hydrogenase expression